MNAETYLSEKEFAERYHVSPRTAQHWRYTGIGGPKFLRSGMRRILYLESDCQNWAASRTFTSRAAEMAQCAA